MTLTQLYLFLVILPNAHSFASGAINCLFLLGVIIGVVLFFPSLDNYFPDNTRNALRKMSRRLIITNSVILVLMGVLQIVTPSDAELYTIAGGYTVTNTKDISKLPDNIVGAANAYLKEIADKTQTKK